MKKLLLTLTLISVFVSANAFAGTICTLTFGFSYKSSDSSDDLKLWKENLSHMVSQKVNSLNVWQDCYKKALSIAPAMPFFVNWNFSNVTSKNVPVHAAVEWVTTPLGSGTVDKGTDAANVQQGDQRSTKGQYKIIQTDSTK